MGLNTIRRGISYSMNIVAVRAMQKVTPQIGFDYLKKLGFTTLVDYQVGADGAVYSDIGLPLALGGLTNGVSNIEMTAAFASIANAGVYNEPYYYTKVLDHSGNVILRKETTSRQVMKTSTAYLLTSAMQDTIVRGLGSTTQPNFLEYKMPIAGKTGTTTNSVDRWFCAYTPYYTCSIWMGFDNNFEIENHTQNYIWRDVMEAIHKEKQLAYKEFTMPDSIVTATVCTKSGLLAKAGVCDAYAGGSTVREEYFAKGTIPTEYCTNVEEQVLLVKDEPIIYYPTELDPTTATPTPVPEGYIPTEKELEQIKVQYVYTTSDTKYILPSEYCTIHTFVETPFDPFAPVDPLVPGAPIGPQTPPDPFAPAIPSPTPTPIPDPTDTFSNGSYQPH